MKTSRYELKFEDRNDYLYAHLTGEDSFSASLQYWNDIADEIARLGYRRLLVHEDLTDHISGRETYDLIMDLKDSVLMKVKIAFYDEHTEDTFLNNIGRIAANHRGGHVRIFKRLDDARKWIEQDR